jgi:hypothetical protein
MALPKKKKRTHEAAIELLRDPRFFFLMGQKLEEMGVVGEEQNRLLIFLACVTKDLRSAVSVIVKGSTSSGKSNLLRTVIRLFPVECVSNLASLTPKALVYGDGDLSGKILYLSEYRGAKDAMYLTRLQQSEGQIAHEYTAVSGRRRSTIVARRRGSPVVLTTTTEHSVFADDETRFLSLRANESAELTRRIIRSRLLPRTAQKSQPPLEVWREATTLLALRVPKFRYPSWFESIADLMPVDETRVRRDVERFCSLLEAVALCRSYSDGRREAHTNSIEINFADYCSAYGIANEAFSSTYRGTHPQALRIAESVHRIQAELHRPVTVREVAQEQGWELPLAYKWVKVAVRDKVVSYEPGTRARNQKRLVSQKNRRTRFLPHPRRILGERPELNEQTVYFDPLTGEKRAVRRHSKRGGN